MDLTKRTNKGISVLLVLATALSLTACGNVQQTAQIDKNQTETQTAEKTDDTDPLQEEQPDFATLDDEGLPSYIEDAVYSDLIDDVGDGYIVEDVSVKYISQEYLDELAYNSQENVYFGYNLTDLEKQFNGEHFVFTYEDGQTKVKGFQEYDDTYDQVVRNVAVGGGVILICVTVSAITGGAGAPAAGAIFAAAAKTGTTVALSSGAISAAAAGITTGLESKDLDAALKNAALEGSKGFKWGAICGAVTGGTSELFTLASGTVKGLSLNEVAQIQKESKYSIDVIKNISSMKEYNLYKEAGLTYKTINGKGALIQKIDLTYESETGGKMLTNLERMGKGMAPIDPATGKAYELHHVGQAVDSPLAILTQEEHRLGDSNKILHDPNIKSGTGVHAQLSDAEWHKQTKEFWKEYFKLVTT